MRTLRHDSDDEADEADVARRPDVLPPHGASFARSVGQAEDRDHDNEDDDDENVVGMFEEMEHERDEIERMQKIMRQRQLRSQARGSNGDEDDGAESDDGEEDDDNSDGSDDDDGEAMGGLKENTADDGDDAGGADDVGDTTTATSSRRFRSARNRRRRDDDSDDDGGERDDDDDDDYDRDDGEERRHREEDDDDDDDGGRRAGPLSALGRMAVLQGRASNSRGALKRNRVVADDAEWVSDEEEAEDMQGGSGQMVRPAATNPMDGRYTMTEEPVDPADAMDVDHGDDEEFKDDADEDEAVYATKFDQEVVDAHLQKFHPECVAHSSEEVAAMARVVYDAFGNINDPLHRMLPVLSIYERARIIGMRAKQFEQGAEPLIDIPKDIINCQVMAEMELAAKMTPFIIERPLPPPARGSEFWHVRDLQQLRR